MKRHNKSVLVLLKCISVVLLLGAAVGLAIRFRQAPLPRQCQPSSFQELLAVAPDKLRSCDVAAVNLLCAEGLPGAEGLEIAASLKRLDEWVAQVRSETTRNLHRFRENPSEGDHSEAKWRMLMLVTVLQQDCGVRYNPARIGAPQSTPVRDAFFADSRDVFLHGLLASRRVGTCSSMPVLYVAVGRRLGYPLKLVTTKGHLFVRWEDVGGKERFNFEGAGLGGEFHLDEYYRHWPFELSQAEVSANGYLQSLDAKGELAVFLSIRAMCLLEANRNAEAAASFESATRLAPGCRDYQLMADRLRQRLGGTVADNRMNRIER